MRCKAKSFKYYSANSTTAILSFEEFLWTTATILRRIFQFTFSDMYSEKLYVEKIDATTVENSDDVNNSYRERDNSNEI